MMKKYLLALLIVPSLVCAMEIVKNVYYNEPTNTIIAWCQTTGNQDSVATTVFKNCDSGVFTSYGVRCPLAEEGEEEGINEKGIVTMLKKMIAEFELEKKDS